jgi:hypothetical protein
LAVVVGTSIHYSEVWVRNIRSFFYSLASSTVP